MISSHIHRFNTCISNNFTAGYDYYLFFRGYDKYDMMARLAAMFGTSVYLLHQKLLQCGGSRIDKLLTFVSQNLKTNQKCR